MLSPGRRCLAVLGALAAVAAAGMNPVSARQSRVASERPPGPTIDFTAVQADGTPVADLQASEVEIRVSGRLRTIRSLRRVTTAAAPPVTPPGSSVPIPPPYGTNENVAAGRSFVFVVDEESFVAGREQLLRGAVEGLLAEFAPADQAMVVALPFGGVKVPFSSDETAIRLAMAGLAGTGSRDETGSDLACRTRRFVDALDGFLAAQAGRTRPLTVIVFTAGLAAPRRDAPALHAPGMCELLVDHFKRIAAAAGAARANFYVMQPADVAMSGGVWRESIAGVGYLGSDNPLEGIEHLAGVTGGERLPLDAAGTAALRRVARESAAYYVAELEPDRREIFNRSRPLAVRASRAGVIVRARPEITFTEARAPKGNATRLAVTSLLTSGEPFTDLPLRTAGFTVREAGGQLRVGIVVEPVDPTVPLASAGAVLIDGTGQVAGRWYAQDAMKRPVVGAIAAAPGTYRLRVAAIDAAGRPGAAEEAVDVGLTPVGPLLLGSLMLSVSRGGGVAPRLEFSAEPTAIASFDIYGGAAGLPLAATLELARTLDGPALLAVPITLTRADESRVVATGAVPIGALAAGDYAVRGIIRLEDGVNGRVIRTLRKAAR